MHIQINLLAEFRVTIDGRQAAAAAWRRTRSAALVKRLALADGHRLHREQAMEALWPELEPAAAAANLRKAVHFARRAIGAHEAISVDGEIVVLAPNADLAIDSEVFEAAAKAALRTNDTALCERAAQLYGGDLLPDDRFAEWAEEPRERLRQLYLQILRKAGLWEQVIAADPVDEEAYRALMQAAFDAGNRGEVVRLFQRLRERLRIDLGLGPEAATVKIYESALSPEQSAPPDPVDRVRGLLAWGIVNFNSGDFAKAEHTAKEARTLALHAGMGREIGEASALFGMVAHMQGRWQELFRSEFLDWVCREPAFVPNVFDGHLCLAEFCLCSRAGHESMASAWRELLALAENAGSVPGRALATLILGEAELFSGRLDAAEALLTAAEQLHGETGADAGRALAIHRLAEVALARGQKWRAGRLVRRGLKIAEPTWLAPHLTVRLQAAAVEAAANAAEALDAIAEGDRCCAERVCQVCSVGFRVASSIVLAEAGELEEARRRLVEAERLAGMWEGGPWVAAVWEARGVHRRAQGDHGQASALFREAAGRYAELGRLGDQRRCEARVAALA